MYLKIYVYIGKKVYDYNHNNINININKPYLKTNTSKLVENMKVFELIIIKELGKLTP
jgi:hypothetical protein